MSDYSDQPEPIAAAIAVLIDAERRASGNVPKCGLCGHSETLRVKDAERGVVVAIRREYGLHETPQL